MESIRIMTISSFLLFLDLILFRVRFGGQEYWFEFPDSLRQNKKIIQLNTLYACIEAIY